MSCSSCSLLIGRIKKTLSPSLWGSWLTKTPSASRLARGGRFGRALKTLSSLEYIVPNKFIRKLTVFRLRIVSTFLSYILFYRFPGDKTGRRLPGHMAANIFIKTSTIAVLLSILSAIFVNFRFSTALVTIKSESRNVGYSASNGIDSSDRKSYFTRWKIIPDMRDTRFLFSPQSLGPDPFFSFKIEFSRFWKW